MMRSVWELYCHYYVFGQTLIDKLAMQAGLAKRYRYEFDNYERFLEILNSGQGVVMIGAHVGCWESGAGFFGTYGKRINIVMFDAEHQRIKEVVESNTSRADDFKIIAVNQDAIGAMLEMKVALNNGEYICFNGDRFVNREQTLRTEILGGEALLPSGPFKIATKCRVPVIFYYAMREKRRTYRFIFEEATFEGRPNHEQLVAQYAASLDRISRKYPRQWFNFYDFWNIN
jgi:predicted LPLAT superfamily acyltransferase